MLLCCGMEIEDKGRIPGSNPMGVEESPGTPIVKPEQQEEEERKDKEMEKKKKNEEQSQSLPSDSTAIDSPSKPPWFTALRLLIVFCVINLLNYLDRGVIASNGVNGTRHTCGKDGKCTEGTGIQGAFDLNNFEDGALSSAFMVGLLVASPIFATLAKSVNPFRLIGVGLAIWTVAAAGCGASINFWTIAVCRMLVGVGEASFISLAAPFIDDNAPPAQKAKWLAAFFMCIPTGVALGYVYGGFVGNHLGWRYAFWVEAILMLPFVIMGFVMRPLKLKGFADSELKEAGVSTVNEEKNTSVVVKEDVTGQANSEASKSGRKRGFRYQVSLFLKDMKVLLRNPVYVVNVLGYITYNFVIGAYSYWGPKAGYSIYHMKSPDNIFGGITIFCGILGTLAGGFILDRIGATIPNAFKILFLSTAFGAAFCFVAFWMKSLYAFLVLFSFGELLVFAVQAVVNFVCLQCVKPDERALSIAMSTVSIHIFGDVPSSPLVGLLQDHLNNWRPTSIILTSIWFLAAAIWFLGIFTESKSNGDIENATSVDAVDDTKLQLEENKPEVPKIAE